MLTFSHQKLRVTCRSKLGIKQSVHYWDCFIGWVVTTRVCDGVTPSRSSLKSTPSPQHAVLWPPSFTHPRRNRQRKKVPPPNFSFLPKALLRWSFRSRSFKVWFKCSSIHSVCVHAAQFTASNFKQRLCKRKNRVCSAQICWNYASHWANEMRKGCLWIPNVALQMGVYSKSHLIDHVLPTDREFNNAFGCFEKIRRKYPEIQPKSQGERFQKTDYWWLVLDSWS